MNVKLFFSLTFKVILGCFQIMLTLVILIGCRNEKQTLFSLLPSSKTGIDFNNKVIENDSINIIKIEYVYNGGGVVAADFNNDGLCDIYFGGNLVSGKLFINRGNLTFEDVTAQANILDSLKWRSGAAVVDINQDGLLDIYLCATISTDSSSRANILYVNQGVDSNGIPSFIDEAVSYGIADTGYSSNAAFFDYDRDGDLDLYVLTNMIESSAPTNYRHKITDGSALNTDRLYRNNGNGSFTNVSKEAGIVYEGYGLGLAISDLNQDGWPDIYVSNDYISNDILYINKGDGTFSNEIDHFIKHQSQFSMGNNVADINNDALPDIMTLDMLPDGNLRRKTVISGVSYTSYLNNRQYNYAHQYIRNMVQLNNGDGTFSEVGQMMGLHQTEWSWSTLFADFDNDGLKDLMVTNGFPKDITDKDFTNFRSGAAGAVATPMFLSDAIPAVKVPNKAYKNMDGISFKEVTKEWGMDVTSFSNGAAYADFDNDGDLDYVVNNINDKAFFYENNLYKKDKKIANHYVRIRLKGELNNRSGLGSRIYAWFGDGTVQYFDHSIYKGYISCVEDFIHIGLGERSIIDSLRIYWPDHKTQLIRDIKADQQITIDYTNSIDAVNSKSINQDITDLYFNNISNTEDIPKFKHQENDIIDFNIQRTIPHKFSQYGPGIAVGDVDGNGLDDFLIGGSTGYHTTLFLQNLNGAFAESKNFLPIATKADDEGLLLFDSDNDGDLDLYKAHGGFEWEPNHANYQDELYINNGSGGFALDTLALPKLRINSSCVRAADFDNDGDLDLFVGGRVIPGRYPLPAESFILRNINGRFENVTTEIAPQLLQAGMITDGIWTDYDNDGQMDLILVGEFMSIQIYKNTKGKLVKIESPEIDTKKGWWNSIAAGDFDQDGDVDYVVGNLGLNNYYHASEDQPLRIYASDVDGNGSTDAILTCYFKNEFGKMVEYPIHFWDELNAQSPRFRQRFESYRDFGKATINDLLNESELTTGTNLMANFMQTSLLKNNGAMGFELIPLPKLAQVAPVNGLVVMDVNKDGFLDVVMVGNDYGNEVFAGRYDAFTGVILLGDGKGNFAEVSSTKSGFFVDGDGKGLAKLSSVNGYLIIATQNQDSLKVFNSKLKKDEIEFSPEGLDTSIKFKLANGKVQKMEFYYGSGYLSQSTRKLMIPKGASEIEVQNSFGKWRSIIY